MNGKCIYSKDSFPKGPHYAILEFGSVWIEGDQRSRDAPGHGYPAHSESKAEYYAFTDRAEWEAEITRRSTGPFIRDNFVAFYVSPAQVRTKVQVEVDNAPRFP